MQSKRDMKIVLDGAVEGVNGVWLTHAPPHQLTMIGEPKSARGRSSILLVSSPIFDRERGQLILDADWIVVLNLGNSSRTIVIDTIITAETLSEGAETLSEIVSEGPGDREFRLLAEQELHGLAQEAAIDLIREVRRRWPGDLKRGERNNFSNTPDNFWYVIIQPRVQAVSVTIRGRPESFESSVFKLVTDRPGFTRFVVRAPEEVGEAVRLIERSKLRRI
jgi:hypothetical protein